MIVNNLHKKLSMGMNFISIKIWPSNEMRKSQEALVAIFPSIALRTIK